MDGQVLAQLLEENNQLTAFRSQMQDDVKHSKETVNKLVADVTKALHPDDDGKPNPEELQELLVTLNASVTSLTALEDKYSEFDARMNSLSKIITDMNTRVNVAISNMNNAINEQKQYGMIMNLLVKNLSNVPTNLNNFAFINWLCNELNRLLPGLTVPLHFFLIEAAHPLPLRDGEQSPTVIIKFKYRANRNDVFYNKSSLKGSRIRITEHLIPSNLQILEKAQRHVGVRQTWTRNGKVHTNINKRKHHLKDMATLEKLIEDHQLIELTDEEVKTRDLRPKRSNYSRPTYSGHPDTNEAAPVWNIPPNQWPSQQVPSNQQSQWSTQRTPPSNNLNYGWQKQFPPSGATGNNFNENEFI